MGFVEHGDVPGAIDVERGAADWCQVPALLEADLIRPVAPSGSDDHRVGLVDAAEDMAPEVDVHAPSEGQASLGRVPGSRRRRDLDAARAVPERRVIRESVGRLCDRRRHGCHIATLRGGCVDSQRNLLESTRVSGANEGRPRCIAFGPTRRLFVAGSAEHVVSQLHRLAASGEQKRQVRSLQKRR